MEICQICGNAINWTESFDKYGHEDGDGCVHTDQVASALEAANFKVEVNEATIHNPYIIAILQPTATGLKVIFGEEASTASEDGGYTVGDCDPREVLPSEIVDLLDETFGEIRTA